MALYDLNNPFHVEQFKLRVAKLLDTKGVVELTSKKQRSLSQNAYLHCLFAYMSMRTGYKTDYIKRNWFKYLVNRDIFDNGTHYDKHLRCNVMDLKSSADLTTEQMTTAIDRFRDWAAKEAEIYLPSPDDYRAIQQLEIEISRNTQYVSAH